MTFRFWGVRGSLPCPLSPDALKAKVSAIVQRVQASDLDTPEARERFLAQLPPELFGLVGGNTTCFEVEADPGQVLLVDAGTGIRSLGQARQAEGSQGLHYHVFLTHFHGDHLQGLPFFAGLQSPRNRVTFYSPVAGFESLVRQQVQPPFFPVSLSAFPAQLSFVELTPGALTVAGTEVTWKPVSHPGSCVGYRFARGGRVVVFCTDTELRWEDFQPTLENRAFFGGADVLILDAQYTLGEALDRPAWGHNSSSLAVDFALDFGARTLYLFHHEPDHDDAKVEEIGRLSQWYADHRQPGGLQVRLAREGREERVH